jgi:CRISPR type I-E-associated protein CasB/Cse2
MNRNAFTEQAAAWLDRLRQRGADPGFRAALRHWLSDAARPRAYPALLELRGSLDDEAFNTVAALYAWHPEDRRDGSGLGRLCRQLAAGLSTFEGRLKRLLLCDTEELRRHLQAVILAARAKGVPVDYLQLYLDVRSWPHDHYGEQVRQRWATEFWGPEQETATPQPQEATP